MTKKIIDITYCYNGESSKGVGWCSDCVGSQGITEIKEVEKKGPYDFLTCYEVWKGEKLYRKITICSLSHVTYATGKEE